MNLSIAFFNREGTGLITWPEESATATPVNRTNRDISRAGPGPSPGTLRTVVDVS